MDKELTELRKKLDSFLLISRKGIQQIAKEMGITYSALHAFLQGRRETNYRTQLKMRHYLDKELSTEIIEQKK